MKNINIITVAFTILLSNILIAGNYQNNEGDCLSSDTTLHYDNFIFVNAGTDSIYFSHILPAYCDIDFPYVIENQKKLYKKFQKIKCNNVDYYLQDCNVLLLWQEVDIQSENQFLIELKDGATGNNIAFVYGSENDIGAGDNVRYAYMFPMDSDNTFSDEYQESELSYNLVFDYGSIYLYEILDTDRANEFFGLKYYSPYTNREYKKFIKPNN